MRPWGMPNYQATVPSLLLPVTPSIGVDCVPYSRCSPSCSRSGRVVACSPPPPRWSSFFVDGMACSRCSPCSSRSDSMVDSSPRWSSSSSCSSDQVTELLVFSVLPIIMLGLGTCLMCILLELSVSDFELLESGFCLLHPSCTLKDKAPFGTAPAPDSS
jgi:hypothetical protein